MTRRILILSLICSTLLFASTYSTVAPYENLDLFVNTDDDSDGKNKDNLIKEVQSDQDLDYGSILGDQDTHNDVQSYNMDDEDEDKNISANKNNNIPSTEDFVQESTKLLQDNSDSDLNDEGIHQLTLENSDEDSQTVELQTCSVVRIPVNQTGLNITVNNIFNAAKMIITDVELTTCAEIVEFDCPEGANFCGVEELDETANIELQDEVCNLKFLYLYVFAEEIGGESAIEVKVTPLQKAQCPADNSDSSEEEDTLEGPADNSGEPTQEDEEEEKQIYDGNVEDQSSESGATTGINDNNEGATNTTISDEEYCGQLDFDTCVPANTEICSSRCMWINCKVNNSENETTQTSSGCVPLTWTTDKLQNMCDSMEEYHAAAPENQMIDYPVCEANTGQAIGGDGAHSHVLKIVGLVFLSFFLVFMLVVCCYRRQFRKNQRGCFTPPSWCPNCLFPTMSDDMHMFLPIGARNKNQDREMDYTPPVL